MTPGCKNCRHFKGQTFDKRPGWKRAAGRCLWTMPALPPLPISITRGLGRYNDLSDPPRNAVWPDDGQDCPAWEPTL